MSESLEPVDSSWFNAFRRIIIFTFSPFLHWVLLGLGIWKNIYISRKIPRRHFTMKIEYTQAVHILTRQIVELTDTMWCPLYKNARARLSKLRSTMYKKRGDTWGCGLCLYLSLPQCSVYWPSLINPHNTALLRGKLEAENISIL